MTHYRLARELRGDPPTPAGSAHNNNNMLPLGPQREELVRVPSMGSFAVARSLSSQLKLDHFEIRSISDHDSWYERGGPSPNRSPSPSIMSSRSHERGTTPETDEKYYSDEKASSVAEETEEAEGVPDGVLTGARLALVFSALLLCTFMFSLDQSIVATAIPRIVSDFNSFAAVAWLITAYFVRPP